MHGSTCINLSLIVGFAKRKEFASRVTKGFSFKVTLERTVRLACNFQVISLEILTHFVFETPKGV